MPLPLHLPYKEPQSYGTLEFGLLKGRPKLRASLVPLFFAIVLPWALFALTYMAVASAVHITDPWQSILAIACGGVLLLCLFFAWLDRMVNWPDRQPSMVGFFGVAFLIAWTLGILLGTMSFQSYTFKWFELTRLNTYKGVDPDFARGAQLMDAGFINFLPGTHVQLNASMGYKEEQLYCVAPLQLGPLPPVTYDFWLVGKECCKASRPGFSCGSAQHVHSSGLIGKRLLEEDTSYYKLAVKQAEAAYGILAAHPLFFEHMKEEEAPAGLVTQAQQALHFYLVGYLLFQIAVVLLAIFFYFPTGDR